MDKYEWDCRRLQVRCISARFRMLHTLRMLGLFGLHDMVNRVEIELIDSVIHVYQDEWRR